MGAVFYRMKAIIFIIVSVLVWKSFASEPSQHGLLIDPFHEILELIGAGSNSSLNASQLDTVSNRLFGKLHCKHVGNATEGGNCTKSVCLNRDELFLLLGITNGQEILEDHFGDLATVLAYYALTAQNHCNQVISINQSKQFYRTELGRLLRRGNNVIQYASLQEVLSEFDAIYESDEEKEHESHEDSGDTDHHDDHDDHDHVTSKQSTDHDDDHDHVTAPTAAAMVDDHGHDDSHDHSHESGEHDDDHGVKTMANKCLSAGRIFDEIKKDPYDDVIEDNDIENVAQLLVYHLLSGAKISQYCRILPRPSHFTSGLLQQLHAVNNQIPKTEFVEFLTKLGLTSTSGTSHADPHDGHDHRRRRRSASEAEAFSSISRRSKRAANVNNTQQFSSQCYSADQLLAMYNAPAGTSIPKSTFLNLCPSLLYQQVTNACAPNKSKTSSGMDSAKVYGYGTIAVFLICLCSISGVLVLPCASRSCSRVYNKLLAVFIGLAVGTLITDAVLHLLPSAFGLHNHDEDAHAHSDSPVVFEPYVGYGLVALAGIYAFYFMEMIFNLIGKENSHGHSHEIAFSTLDSGSNNLKQNGTSESKSRLYESQTSFTSTDVENSEKDQQKKKKGAWSAVAVMVILGDSLHNFADGLAIGAAFSQSAGVGIATSITVFCHELPHELGDFAILIASGLSFTKAICFNFLSSLTAFIGLYIGIAVSTDETVRQWIFAATAGLFIYIALVDMMPTMTGGGQGTQSQRLRNVLFHNFGFFIGVIILILLSLFEEKIKIS